MDEGVEALLSHVFKLQSCGVRSSDGGGIPASAITSDRRCGFGTMDMRPSRSRVLVRTFSRANLRLL